MNGYEVARSVASRATGRESDEPALRDARSGRVLTYRAVAAKADSVRAQILDVQSGSGHRIAIEGPPSLETIVDFIGCELAGVSHVFSWEGGEYGARFMEYVRQDAQATGVLCEGDWSEVGVAADDAMVAEEAYVTYTSGSTGEPKGIGVARSALGRYLSWISDIAVQDAGNTLLCTPVRFDLAVAGLYLPLVNGGCIDILSSPIDLEFLAKCLVDPPAGGYDFVRLTPSLLAAALSGLEGGAINRVGVFVLGGEILSEALAARLRRCAPQATIVNHYGPAETVVGCTAHEYDGKTNRESVPIGWARPGRELRIVAEHGSLPVSSTVPGTMGELLIGGDDLGYYIGRASDRERTAFTRVGSETYYRTGDIVEVLSDGSLVFVGRQDRQIKLAGVRIELDGVEEAICRLPDVTGAAVAVLEDGTLGAVVTPGGLSASRLARDARAVLPSVAVPSRVMAVDQIPTAGSGKRSYSEVARVAQSASVSFQGPAETTLDVLRQIWIRLFGIDDIADDDDFFELGGNSLQALRMLAEAAAHGIVLSPADLLRGPRLRDVADKAGRGQVSQGDRSSGTASNAPLREREPSPLQLRELESSGLRSTYGFGCLFNVQGVTESELRSAVEHAIARHPALSERFRRVGGEWEVTYGSTAPTPVVDMGNAPLDFAKLWALASDKCSPATGNNIVVMASPSLSDIRSVGVFVHHLVMDPLSWAPLLTSIDRGLFESNPADYQQDGYLDWIRELGTMLRDPSATGGGKVLRDREARLSQEAKSAHPSHVCEQFRSHRALENFEAFLSGRDMSDPRPVAVLAYAVALVIQARRSGSGTQVPVIVEVHGRQDPTRPAAAGLGTVGWLTDFVPVTVQLSAGIRSAVLAINDQITRAESYSHEYLCELAREGNSVSRWFRSVARVNYLGPSLGATLSFRRLKNLAFGFSSPYRTGLCRDPARPCYGLDLVAYPSSNEANEELGLLLRSNLGGTNRLPGGAPLEQVLEAIERTCAALIGKR